MKRKQKWLAGAWRRSCAGGIALVAVSVPLRSSFAQEVTPATRSAAVELFDAADRLVAEGRLSEACPRYEESYRLDPQLGAVLHLADCLEKDGKLASAYAAFREASEVAQKKGDERRGLADDRSRALEPRLSRLTVEVPDPSRVNGLEVMRDGIPLSRGSC